jgi:hypothetical protein
MSLTGKILTAVFGFFALLLIIALFLPDHYRVERSVSVNLPADSAFAAAADFSIRDKWDPWVTADTGAVTSFEIKPGYTGSRWNWKGKKIGEGEVEITEVKPGKSFKAILRFLRPNRMTARIDWIFEPRGESTLCRWIISGELSYPANRLFGLFIDDILGASMERGLSGFKKSIER